MPKDLHPSAVLAVISRGKTSRCSLVQKNQKVSLEDSKSEKYSGAESKQGSDEEGSYPVEERPPSDDNKGGDHP